MASAPDAGSEHARDTPPDDPRRRQREAAQRAHAIGSDPERQEFLRGYLHCAGFANVVGGDSGPDRLAADELPADFRAQAECDCAAFLDSHADDLTTYAEEVGVWRGGPDSYGRTSYTAMECAGHDFAFTRNGQGTGYWDRDLGDLGTRLSDAARAMGEHWVWVAATT